MATRAVRKQAKALSKASECVRVVVRVRPLNSKELQDGREAAVTVTKSSGQISLRNPKADGREPPKTFTFDNVYGADTQQKDIYDTTVAPLVADVMDGYNGTIFAYGQTGAGKSHTMEGYPDPPELRGIIPNSFRHIFEKIATSGGGGEAKAEAAASGTQFLVRASYLEIYNEEIRDLLSKDPKNRLELKESVDSGVYVRDLKSFVVKSVQEIDQVMQAGKKNRSVGSTLMNQTSSRSHSIFTVTVETSSPSEDGEAHIRVGKLNMVDLAGSERQSKTGATGTRLKEATKINLSLSALGNVISALVDGKSQHIPYRDSKLTRLLQDSLGGNTKTVMCANCGPADYNYDETLSTLRYANRAKNIKNKPKINEDPKDAMLREFQEEILRLKQQLAASGGSGASAGAAPGGGGGGGGLAPVRRVRAEPRIVDKVVEKIVVQKEGVSEEVLREMEEKAAQERAEMRAKARRDIDEMKAVQARTEQDRQRLEMAMKRQQAEALQAVQAKEMLAKKLGAMENKLLQGGQLMDKAARQEAELRDARIELERRKQQEDTLAQELASREESNMLANEQFSGLQEEVDAKTKKLTKLWTKYQAAKTEIEDLQGEFQQEREDMLDTIRELTRDLKLKQVIISNFIPSDELQHLNQRARWDEEGDTWLLPRLHLQGPAVVTQRPMAVPTARRPETNYSRHRMSYDSSPRYRSDNIVQLDLDMPERTTQDYEGAAMSQRVAAALSAALEGDEEEEVEFTAPQMLPNFNPEEQAYQQPTNDGGGGRSSRGARPKSGMRKSKSRAGRSRPGTANRRGRSKQADPSAEMAALLAQEANAAGGGGGGGGGGQYPSARGLVGR